MKTLIIATITATAISAPTRELADIPPEIRQENYSSYGSCTHASIITLLRWHSMDQMADWWRVTYSDGEILYGSIEKLTYAKVKFAYTDQADMKFLEWCVRNRLGAVVYHVPFGHCVNLVDMTKTTVTILDNNTPGQYKVMPRAKFERQWKRNADGAGWALTLVYTPPPPWPVRY